MRKFTIVSFYTLDDEDCSWDAWKVELIDSDGNVILTGDWYHDKIDSQIEGFFHGLSYLGIEYEVEEINRNEDYC